MRSMLIILSLVLSQPAFAAFMAEPMISIVSGTMKITAKGSGESASTGHTGFGAGLRLGNRWSSTWMALELGVTSSSGKSNEITHTFSDTNMGLMFGYDFSKTRIYAGYFPTSDTKWKDDGGGDDITLKGSAIKVGGGWFLTPKTALNIDFFMHSYSKLTDGTNEATVSDVYSTLKNDPLHLTLSYIF